MKYTFENGVQVAGPLDKILLVGKSFGETVNLEKVEGEWSEIPEGYYRSTKTGTLRELSKMNVKYLQNALLKRTVTYIDELKKQKDIIDTNDFLTTYVSLTEDKAISTLFEELSKR